MFWIIFSDKKEMTLPKSYVDAEYDSVHEKWIFYHKNGRDKREYSKDNVHLVGIR